MRLKVSNFSKFRSTYDGKSLIVKTLLLPIFVYGSRVYDLALQQRRNVRKVVENYVFSTGAKLNMETISKTRENGGYDCIDIPLYLDILKLKVVKKYYNARKQNNSIHLPLYFLEYYIGFTLCKMLAMPVNNSVLHASQPTSYYSNVVDILKRYSITIDEIAEKTTKQIYRRIVNERNAQVLVPMFPINMPNMWTGIHNKVLPNYLKTFGYKMVWNVLPLCINERIARIQKTSRCPLCDLHDEDVYQLFYDCVCIQPIWDYVNVIIFNISGVLMPKVSPQMCIALDLSSLKQLCVCETNLNATILLLSISRYCIWLSRNKVIFEQEPFLYQDVINRIKAMSKARNSAEKSRQTSVYNSVTQILWNSMCSN
ncbi:unnamed protein product [Clavelina lepadiformis]|uniref:Reverse transcriptase zinc-binding domain-containing protein n=1 Tax=Clavelina lepadiformis TaxID=159417 RepID=A0ABP0GKS7_CLALP